MPVPIAFENMDADERSIMDAMWGDIVTTLNTIAKNCDDVEFGKTYKMRTADCTNYAISEQMFMTVFSVFNDRGEFYIAVHLDKYNDFKPSVITMHGNNIGVPMSRMLEGWLHIYNEQIKGGDNA